MKSKIRFKEPVGDLWAVNTLHRATKVGEKVYERALARKVEWPKPKEDQKNPIENPPVYTSIDDAFATILQFMSQTTKQCKRYYTSNPDQAEDTCWDDTHCRRFHTPQYAAVQHRNPLSRSEDVHVVVSPGTYAVTTGTWGTKQQQSHVVHVNEGQEVNLDFVI